MRDGKSYAKSCLMWLHQDQTAQSGERPTHPYRGVSTLFFWYPAIVPIEKKVGRHGNVTWRVRIRQRGHAQMSSTFTRRVLAERWQAKTLNELEENRYFGPNELKERVKELEASNWRLHEANRALEKRT